MNRVLLAGAVFFFVLMTTVFAASVNNYPDGELIPYACSELDEFETSLVPGAFGPPDSSDGRGAVDICNHCYPCGRADGVCPADFYDGTVASVGVCAQAPDPDCSGCVTLSVSLNISGTIVSASDGVQISLSYDVDEFTEFNGPVPVTVSGDELSFSVITGTAFTIVASYTDPVDPSEVYTAQLYVPAGAVQRTGTCYGANTLLSGDDLILNPALCEADCTREGSSFCDPTCFGVDACPAYGANNGYTQSDIVSALASGLYEEGDQVVLGEPFFDEDSCMATTYYFNACMGPVQSTDDFVLTASCNQIGSDDAILNLVTRVHRVRYDRDSGSLPVELVIMHWDEEIDS